jgi:ubiquinone/menaquinone biosynthesis C-methylase UbiE
VDRGFRLQHAGADLLRAGPEGARRDPAGRPDPGDLPRRLRTINSAQTSTPGIASTYERMASDGAAARRFTRMLFEVHRPLARELARALDLEGVTRLMDLGGGSGVVSIELARRHPALSSTIVDLPTVCAAGAEVVAAEGLSQRISFHPADFLRDPLPRGFPVVLECDVDVYDTALLQNVRAALDPGGRYLVVDQFAPRDGDVAPSRAHWAFARSMLDPTYTPMSLPRFRDLLESNGFDVVKESRLEPSPGAGARFARGVTVLEARRAA